MVAAIEEDALSEEDLTALWLQAYWLNGNKWPHPGVVFVPLVGWRQQAPVDAYVLPPELYNEVRARPLLQALMAAYSQIVAGHRSRSRMRTPGGAKKKNPDK